MICGESNMHNQPSWKKGSEKGSEEEDTKIIMGIKCLANERMQA